MKKLSSCCHAPLTVCGSEFGTRWYVCSKCNKDCNDRIQITKEDYNKLCDIAIEKGKSVEDTLMDLLEIAGKYNIK